MTSQQIEHGLTILVVLLLLLIFLLIFFLIFLRLFVLLIFFVVVLRETTSSTRRVSGRTCRLRSRLQPEKNVRDVICDGVSCLRGKRGLRGEGGDAVGVHSVGTDCDDWRCFVCLRLMFLLLLLHPLLVLQL